jgi:hemoglobin-like flavoprotein
MYAVVSIPSPHAEAFTETPLTREQKCLIRQSFARLEPASDLVAALFFLKLFDLDPSLRALFKGSLKAQGRKFMAAMRIALISLDHQEQLEPVLKLLGVHYRHYGVQAGHYVTFARALIWTFERALEARFTREAKEAWTKLLAQMTRIMAP